MLPSEATVLSEEPTHLLQDERKNPREKPCSYQVPGNLVLQEISGK